MFKSDSEQKLSFLFPLNMNLWRQFDHAIIIGFDTNCNLIADQLKQIIPFICIII
jgi:hypothetical protein